MSFLKNYTNISDNKKLYGGNAGLKKGITINNEDWIIKFPQETSTFEKVGISFTTAPVCEYIASHIYEILGFDVHQTELGICKNQNFERDFLVVACKDFTENGKFKLVDYEAIKNNFSDDLQDKLIELNNRLPIINKENYLEHTLSIEEVILQFKYNEIFKCVPDIKHRFWCMLIIDCLINNNDRNKNNWGLLENVHSKTFSIAPIYDNGSAFVSKHTDEKLERLLADDNIFKNSVLNGMCYYTVRRKLSNFDNFFKNLKENNLDEDLRKVAKELVPLIQNKMQEITNFINNLPTSEQGIEIISETKKKYFIRSMNVRLEEIINKAL